MTPPSTLISPRSPAVFIAVCFLAVILINVCGTRAYGETEFCERPAQPFEELADSSTCRVRWVSMAELGRGAAQLTLSAAYPPCSIKIVTIIGLIILGIVIDVGGGPTRE